MREGFDCFFELGSFDRKTRARKDILTEMRPGLVLGVKDRTVGVDWRSAFFSLLLFIRRLAEDSRIGGCKPTRN